MVTMALYVLWPARRYASGCCRACGYNLRGNISGVCPECGTPVVSIAQTRSEAGPLASAGAGLGAIAGGALSRHRWLARFAAALVFLACLCTVWSFLAWRARFAPPGDYDLAWTFFWGGPLPAEESSDIHFYMAFKNLGKDEIPEATYGYVLYLDGRFAASSEHWEPLPPEKGLRTNVGSSDLRQGTYTYRFVLDEENRVQETDETNNVIEGTFTVLPKGHPDIGKDVSADSLMKQLATRPGLLPP